MSPQNKLLMFQREHKTIGIGDFIQYDKTNGTKAYGIITDSVQNNRLQAPIGFRIDWITNGEGMLDTVFGSGYNSTWSKAQHK